MEDLFNIERESPIGPLLSFVLFMILFFLTNPAIHFPYKLKEKRIRWIIVLLVIFGIFATFGGDWFHYQEIIGRIYRKRLSLEELETISSQVHLEQVYWYIAYFVNYNYLLFRFFVFGGALLLLFYSVNKIGTVRLSVFFAFFVSGTILSFTTSRVCLAQSIALLGTIIIYRAQIKNRINILKYIIGVSLIFVSFFFHKSALFFIFIIVLTQLPFGFKTLLAVLIVFPVLLYFTNTYFVDFIMSAETSEDEVLNYTSFQSYLSGNRSYGVGTTILIFLHRLYWYSLSFLCIIIVSIKKGNIPFIIKKFALMTFWIVIIASMTIFQNQTVFNRLIGFSNIAALPVVSYCLVAGIKKKFVLNLYYLGSIIIFYSLVLQTIGRILLY